MRARVKVERWGGGKRRKECQSDRECTCTCLLFTDTVVVEAFPGVNVITVSVAGESKSERKGVKNTGRDHRTQAATQHFVVNGTLSVGRFHDTKKI